MYHLMYGKLQTSPCLMRTIWIGGLSGVARRLEQNVDFDIAAAAEQARSASTGVTVGAALAAEHPMQEALGSGLIAWLLDGMSSTTPC